MQKKDKDYKIDKSRVNYLVRCIGNEDKHAAEVLYNLTKDYLYHLALQRCHNIHDAEDAVGETFKIILDIARDKMFYTNCLSWMISILYNTLSTNYRKLKPIYSLEMVDMVCGEDLEIRDLYIKLEVNKLDYESQLIVHYIYNLGFKVYETAKIMGTSLATFKRKHAKLLRKLEEMLKDEEK